MRRLSAMIALALAALSFAPAPALAGPAEDASGVIDRWTAAYSANDPAAVMKLYAADAVLFGTARPIVFDGTEPIAAQFAGLPGSGDGVRICRRQMLVLGAEAVLATGAYEFIGADNGVRVAMPGGFTMLIVKRDGAWHISYHTSSRPQPAQEATIGKGGARQASVVPIVPADCE
ncbi:MAG TPA: nuclear transport factor 2 family protein [Xanthobacteraceae bacterium]|nr:nuclear transport factor 2 family protein [Xanthobacteraceae bacterium]